MKLKKKPMKLRTRHRGIKVEKDRKKEKAKDNKNALKEQFESWE